MDRPRASNRMNAARIHSISATSTASSDVYREAGCLRFSKWLQHSLHIRVTRSSMVQEETIQAMRHGSFRNTALYCTQNFLNKHCLNGKREERRRNKKQLHLEATAAKYNTIRVTGDILLGSGDFLSSKMFRESII